LTATWLSFGSQVSRYVSNSISTLGEMPPMEELLAP